MTPAFILFAIAFVHFGQFYFAIMNMLFFVRIFLCLDK